MNVMTRLTTAGLLACLAGLTPTGAAAWWDDDDHYDRWYGGPWYGGYPGYGWGGYPGYYGYPGYGYPGYGYPGSRYPSTIIVNPPRDEGRDAPPQPRLPR
jgi:hypothetical protein